MFVNILIFLLLIGLAVLFGWLTWRAIRAKRLWVKIVGGIGAGLLTLFFAAVAFTGGKGIATVYFPGAQPAPALTVAATPEQVARGEYLTNLSCIGCHSAVTAEGMPSEAHPLTGGWNIAAAEGFGFMGDMITENLTPGGKLANYSDGELFRVLRHGIDQEGQQLGFMALLPYPQLSDDDTQAIVAYLRTLPAAPSSGASGDNLNFLGMLLYGSGMFPLPEPAAATVVAPPPGVNAEYGKYVATFGECRGCHGPDATGTAASAMGPAIPNPRLLVGTLSQEQFFADDAQRRQARRRGLPGDHALEERRKMTDDDLAALYAYLTAPVQ